jgi:hypothetical protein
MKAQSRTHVPINGTEKFVSVQAFGLMMKTSDLSVLNENALTFMRAMRWLDWMAQRRFDDPGTRCLWRTLPESPFLSK